MRCIVLKLAILLPFVSVLSACDEVVLNHDATMRNVVKETTGNELVNRTIEFDIEDDHYSFGLEDFTFYKADIEHFGFEGYSANCSFEQSGRRVKVPRLDLICDSSEGTYLLDGTVIVEGDSNLYALEIDGISNLNSHFNLNENTGEDELVNQQFFENWYLRNFADFTVGDNSDLVMACTNEDLANDKILTMFLGHYGVDLETNVLNEIFEYFNNINVYAQNTTASAGSCVMSAFAQTTKLKDNQEVEEYVTDIFTVDVIAGLSKSKSFESGNEMMILGLKPRECVSYFTEVESGEVRLKRALYNPTYTIANAEFDLYVSDPRRAEYGEEGYSNTNRTIDFVKSAYYVDDVGIKYHGQLNVYEKVDYMEKSPLLHPALPSVSNAGVIDATKAPIYKTDPVSLLDGFSSEIAITREFISGNDGFNDYSNALNELGNYVTFLDIKPQENSIGETVVEGDEIVYCVSYLHDHYGLTEGDDAVPPLMFISGGYSFELIRKNIYQNVVSSDEFVNVVNISGNTGCMYDTLDGISNQYFAYTSLNRWYEEDLISF